MTNRDEQIIEILKKQIEVEEKALTLIGKAEESASETAVRLVFLEMRLDSYKHKKFLEGLVALIEQTPCDEWSAKIQRYVDRVKLKRHLDSIMADENEMISLTKQAIDLMEDPIGEKLLTHLVQDEVRHTRDLTEIVKMVQMLPLQAKKAQKGTDIKCVD